ncbi:kunitz-like peptide PcKuz1 [Colias croceus]|uniref:kunitz-like peptide PcKuz1 n=1 Tax=Colias crocea TaxID=72248 RepID=UPI001E27F015|nr:kunitz-like peptide PcKuz1 [Colias croceus]
MKVLLKLSFVYVIFSLLYPINGENSILDIINRPYDCYLQADIGLCRGYIIRYYFDVKTKSCREFGYGGCGGNGNRFRTMSACMDICKGVEFHSEEK